MSDDDSNLAYTPYDCPSCAAGRMIWRRSKANTEHNAVELHFTCSECGREEIISTPFTLPEG